MHTIVVEVVGRGVVPQDRAGWRARDMGRGGGEAVGGERGVG